MGRTVPRRPVVAGIGHPAGSFGKDAAELRPPMPLTRSVSLRWRVTLLAASLVAVAVAVTSIAAYAMVARSLYADVDAQLRARAALMIDNNFDSLGFQSIVLAGLYSSDVGVALIFPDGADLQRYVPPQATKPPIGSQEEAVARGELGFSLRTVDNQRVLARRTNSGSTLVVSQRLQPTREVLDRLAWLLFVVGGCGVVLAAAAGTAVARTGLRPVARLTAATERVARTDDLTPIPVSGDDELARLTESFNTMLRALAESRERQRRLVSDAGHELKTPLTSLRTNMELLIASSRPGAPRIPDEDMAELRGDVMAQIEELSTLVGDLVDLAREDAPETVYEQVDIGDVAERALERVRRRRTAIATLGVSDLSGGQSGSIGLGFAIPVDQARRVADELIKTGKVTYAQIGIKVRGQDDVNGARVVEVTPDGAAAAAGIPNGAIITKLDDQVIDSGNALIAAVRSHQPGDKVKITYTDEQGNNSRTVEVTLGEVVEGGR